MERLSSAKLNSVGLANSGYYHKKLYDEVSPTPECRDLYHVDSRCLYMLGPYTLLGVLPKQLSNPKNLKTIVDKNPHLKDVLRKNNINLSNGDFVNFLNFTDEHMRTTAYIAGEICKNMNKPVDRIRVIKAARLHDIGKIFIPSKILNKPDNLTSEEKKIMSMHSDLGYELLSTLNIDKQTLNLIKNHHKYNKNSSLEQQIVSAADIFAALTENRPYKKSMSNERALSIIRQTNFSPEIIKALESIIETDSTSKYRIAS